MNFGYLARKNCAAVFGLITESGLTSERSYNRTATVGHLIIIRRILKKLLTRKKINKKELEKKYNFTAYERKDFQNLSFLIYLFIYY